MAVDLDHLLYGIRTQETGPGGNYGIVNSIGAVGAYQVMTANIPSWTKEALGRTLTREQFRTSRDAQDKVARYFIGKYFRKYGAAGAAAMWYSGQSDPTKTYGNPPVYQYVREVLAKALGGTITGGANQTDGGSSTDGGVEQAGVSDILKWPSDIIGFFGDATDALGDVAEFFVAFFRPSTYIRIACGWFGFFFLMLSLYCFARETRTA